MSNHTGVHRSRKRRSAEAQLGHSPFQPYPTMSPTYHNNHLSPQGNPGSAMFETASDIVMNDYAGSMAYDIGVISASNSSQGSIGSAVSPSWTGVFPGSSIEMVEATGSMVNVQHAHVNMPMNYMYPGHPNSTSNFPLNSDLVSYPTPEAPAQQDWTLGAEYAVDQESLDEDVSSMPHDANYILGFSVPHTLDNPYQAHEASRVEPNFWQSLQHYQHDQSVVHTQAQIPLVKAQAEKFHSDDPWSHIDPQVPKYSPGFVAFGLSPGPQGELDSETSSSRASSEPQSPQISKALVKKSRPSEATVKQEPQLSWEHASVKNGVFQIPDKKEKHSKPRSGRRSGKLKPETAEKAKRIRQQKACWKCWVQKASCSEEEICERCARSSPTSDQLCFRGNFSSFEEAFFPDFLHAHLKQAKVEHLISANSDGFTDDELHVKLSVGSCFEPMKLTANFFLPKGVRLLRQRRLMYAENEDYTQLKERNSAPLGILSLQPKTVKRWCNRYIETMIESPEYAKQVTAGDGSKFLLSLLEIMQEHAKTNSLVKDAMKLHAMHYFMSTLITFTPLSAREVYSFLGHPLPHDEYLSSRLLNRQIKHQMHELHCELTASVLESLEHSLRARTIDHWAPSFSAILIICLCIENLQTAADTMVVCDMLIEDESEGLERTQSMKACAALEQSPFAQCKNLFHDIYKSQNQEIEGGRKSGFNPLRALWNGGQTRLRDEEDLMVRNTCAMISENWAEISALAEREALLERDYLNLPGYIRPHNTGRLASKFLLSFREGC